MKNVKETTTEGFPLERLARGDQIKERTGSDRPLGAGFPRIEFQDFYDHHCAIDQSTICLLRQYPDAIDHPGSSALWLGRDGVCMHLDRDGVRALATVLNRWLETGEIYEP